MKAEIMDSVNMIHNTRYTQWRMFHSLLRSDYFDPVSLPVLRYHQVSF